VQQRFKTYLNYTCAATFFDPNKALTFLQEQEVDLIFLDIEMPEMNGFQFLDALKKKIFVVIFTAYSEKHSLFAHNYYFDKDLVYFANKAQLLYYFPKIIARFEKLHAEKGIMDKINQLSKNEITTFPKKINNELIPLADILFITVIGHNIVLKMKNEEEFIFRMSLSELMSFLPANTFLLINRNTTINILNITTFSDTTVSIKDHHFFLSTSKQKKVIEILKNRLCPLYKTMD
jgi:DNA-binding LytR/AlgR family response regulator